MDDVLAAWYAVDADVEEAADGDGEEKCIYEYKAMLINHYCYIIPSNYFSIKMVLYAISISLKLYMQTIISYL